VALDQFASEWRGSIRDFSGCLLLLKDQDLLSGCNIGGVSYLSGQVYEAEL
jgi:hypothetical protein